MSDFELILVNDGSKDRSGELCREYESVDSRIRVVEKTNGGVSSARNAGLDVAVGKYISFIDADDSVKPDYIEKLLVVFTPKTDLSIDKCTIVLEDGDFSEEKYTAMTCGKENFSDLFVPGRLFRRTSPWGKLYRREIIEYEHLRFNENVHLGEDAIFLFSYLLHCRNVAMIDNGGYLYRFDAPGTLTKRINSVESESLALSAISNLCDRIANLPYIDNAVINNELTRLKGYYVRRNLDALYYSDLKREDRITRIKELPLKYYIDNYPVDSGRERFYKILLKKRMSSVYDALRHAIVLIKR